MNGLLEKTIYIPLVLPNNVESAIATGQHHGACTFFEIKEQAEQFLERIKQHPNMSDVKTKILVYKQVQVES